LSHIIEVLWHSKYHVSNSYVTYS